MERKLTVPEVAKHFGISEGAVRAKIHRGTLPTVKEAGRTYVLVKDNPSEALTADALKDTIKRQDEQITFLRGQVEQLTAVVQAQQETMRTQEERLAEQMKAIQSAIQKALPAPEEKRGWRWPWQR